MAIRFEARDDVQVAFVDRTVQDGHQGARTVTYAARVMPEKDATGAVAHYRIDKTAAVGGAWLPWEAINRTEYPTPAAARRGIREWAAGEGVA